MKTNNQLRGTTLIIISAFFFSTYGIWSRMMSGYFGTFNQAWIRGLIISIVLIVIGLATNKFKKIKRKDLKWFFIISLAGGLNQAPYYYAFENLDIGTATMLFYASLTIGGFIFGRFFFREKITPVKSIALLLAIAGMLLIFGFNIAGGWLPLTMAAVAGFMGSIGVVFSKKISSNYSIIQDLTFLFIGMFIYNLIISFAIGETTPALVLNTAWFGQIGYSIAMLVANYTVVGGFKYLEPSIATLIGLLEIIFAAILGLVLFGESLTLGLVAGGVLIMLSAGLPEIGSLVNKKRQ